VRGVCFDFVFAIQLMRGISQSTVGKFEQGRCQTARILFNHRRKIRFAPSANGFAARKNLSRPATVRRAMKFLRGFIQRE